MEVTAISVRQSRLAKAVAKVLVLRRLRIGLPLGTLVREAWVQALARVERRPSLVAARF